MNGIKYSVIIPMYNEEEVILESYRRLDNVMRPLGEEYELIFVNDGSRDRTMEIMLDVAKKDPHVKIAVSYTHLDVYKRQEFAYK